MLRVEFRENLRHGCGRFSRSGEETAVLVCLCVYVFLKLMCCNWCV